MMDGKERETTETFSQPIAQSVVSPIEDPGVMGSILAQFYTFVGVDHEIFTPCR